MIAKVRRRATSFWNTADIRRKLRRPPRGDKPVLKMSVSCEAWFGPSALAKDALAARLVAAARAAGVTLDPPGAGEGEHFSGLSTALQAKLGRTDSTEVYFAV